MKRRDILDRLRQCAPALQATGVAHLSLFGSAARDEMGPESDVDVLVEFEPGVKVTLLMLGGLQYDLCETLGVDVDLASAAWLKEPIRQRALREAVLAF